MRTRREARLLDSLATSLQAGMPVPEALHLLASRAGASGRPDPTEETARRVIAGAPLSEALARSGILQPWEQPLLEAGEISGEIPEALRRVAAEREQRAAARDDMLRRIAYPLLILHLAALVFAWVAYLQNDSGVLAAAAIVGPFWILVALTCQVARRARTHPSFAHLLLGIPIIGPLLAGEATLTFLRVFKMAYAGGVKAGKAAEVARGCVSNVVVRRRLTPLVAGLENGRPLASLLGVLPGLEPALSGILAAGEKSGSLSEALDQVVAIRARELDLGRARLLAAAGWLLYVLAMVVVATRIIGFYTSYFARLA